MEMKEKRREKFHRILGIKGISELPDQESWTSHFKIFHYFLILNLEGYMVGS